MYKITATILVDKEREKEYYMNKERVKWTIRLMHIPRGPVA